MFTKHSRKKPRTSSEKRTPEEDCIIVSGCSEVKGELTPEDSWRSDLGRQRVECKRRDNGTSFSAGRGDTVCRSAIFCREYFSREALQWFELRIDRYERERELTYVVL